MCWTVKGPLRGAWAPSLQPVSWADGEGWTDSHSHTWDSLSSSSSPGSLLSGPLPCPTQSSSGKLLVLRQHLGEWGTLFPSPPGESCTIQVPCPSLHPRSAPSCPALRAETAPVLKIPHRMHLCHATLLSSFPGTFSFLPPAHLATAPPSLGFPSLELPYRPAHTSGCLFTFHTSAGTVPQSGIKAAPWVPGSSGIVDRAAHQGTHCHSSRLRSTGILRLKTPRLTEVETRADSPQCTFSLHQQQRLDSRMKPGEPHALP